MNKKLITVLLTAFTCAAGLTAVHADCVVDSTSTPGKVIISGALDSKKAGELISVQILPEDVEFTTQHTLNEDKRMYANQTKSDENGAFYIEFESDADYGNYVAYVSSTSEFNDEEFWFTNKDQNKQDLGLLLEVKNDSTAFVAQAASKYQLLLLDNPLYETPDSGVLEMLRAYVISEEITAEDGEKLAAIYDTLCLIDALNKGSITSLEANIKDSDISNLSLRDWYNGLKGNSEAESYIFARLKGKGITTIEDFEKKLAESVVLYTVYRPNGAGNIKSILSDLQNFTEISITGIKDKTYTLLAGKRYNDYGELKRAIETFNSQDTGSGGGGGGSSSSGSGMSAIPSIQPGNQPVQLKTFADLDGFGWARTAIMSLANSGVVAGTSETSFEPARNVKREECVKMLVCALNINTLGYNSTFSDVKENDWFAPYVVAAKSNGIVNGVSKDKFGSGLEIRREDLAVIIYNAIKDKGIKTNESQAFADEGEISNYAKTAVEFVKAAGIISGRGDNTFAPNAPATRAEVAVVIHRVMELLK